MSNRAKKRRKSSLPLIYSILAWICVAVGVFILGPFRDTPNLYAAPFAAGFFACALGLAATARLLSYGERCAIALEALVSLQRADREVLDLDDRERLS